MPALPVVPNVVKIKTVFDIGTDTTVQTGWHFSYTGTPPDDAAALAMAVAIHTGGDTHLLPALSTACFLTGVEVTDLSAVSGGQGLSTASNGGSRSGTPVTAGACCLVHQPILRRYRGGKSRTYWPFFVTGDILTPQTWTTTAVTDAQTAISGYFTSIVGVSSGGCTLVTLVNVSYYSGFTAVTNPITGRTKDVNKVRVGGPVVDVVQSATVSNKVASQRRRNQQRS